MVAEFGFEGDDRMTHILVVEDNAIDVRLLRYSFELEPEWVTAIRVAQDGEEAIHRLLSPDETKPDLVILDFNLPKRDGAEVLRVIRSKLPAPRVPVIVFSSSEGDLIKNKLEEENLDAEGYITKPAGLVPFSAIATQFRECYERAISRTNSGSR